MNIVKEQCVNKDFDELRVVSLLSKDVVAYQRDMHVSIEYGKDYFENYEVIQDTEIANKINLARTTLVEKYCKNCVLDIGIGCGEFIKKCKLKSYGYDINEFGINWLKERNIFIDIYNDNIPDEVEGFSLWDVLEHIPEPKTLFDRIKVNQFIFISLPIFYNVWDVKKSKHYKPNEHYYYYTKVGLIATMREYGFDILELNNDETIAGRENIGSFAFKKVN